MARYLSAEWFASAASAEPLPEPARLVLEQVVRAAPEGTVVYRVEVSGGHSRIVWPVPDDAPAPDLRISTDWSTAVSVARGDLSTQRALMEGRLRFSGSPDRLGDVSTDLEGIDPVSADVRRATTFNGS